MKMTIYKNRLLIVKINTLFQVFGLYFFISFNFNNKKKKRVIQKYQEVSVKME